MSNRTAAARKDILDEIYLLYHHRQFVQPDPLQFLYGYQDPRDREVVALVASSLAYGRVAQILASVRKVLDVLGPSPRDRLMAVPRRKLDAALGGFKHRFNTGREVAALLWGLRRLIERYGSLGKCVQKSLGKRDETILPALAAMVGELHDLTGGPWNHLLCDVTKGGASKRLNLMLRWLVRPDDGVDIGDWEPLGPQRLLAPLDVHMHRLCKAMGATRRNQADARTVMEITRWFAGICPQDPVKYDFSLTRLGIRGQMSEESFLAYFESA